MLLSLSAAPELPRTAPRRTRTLVDLLRLRARTDPDAVLYELVGADEQPGETVTAGELDRRARDLGAHLQEMGAQGSRVILLVPTGPDFAAAYFGCQYAGAVAVPAPPLQVGSLADAARLMEMIGDAGARFVITTPELRGDLPFGLERVGVTVLSPPRWLGDRVDDWSPPELDGSSLAHLQYTSGPAGTMRGVMISHANLLHNAEVVRRAIDLSSADRLLSWLAPSHELGLMMGILQPLYAGCRGLLLDAAPLYDTPARWLRAIDRHEVTVTAAPNFAYDLALRETGATERSQLDLSSLRVAMIGAEPVRARTLAEFAAAFERCGFDSLAFFPFHSSAEATLLVTGGRRPTSPAFAAFDPEELEGGRARLVPDQKGRLLAGSGQPRPGQLVRTVDPSSGRTCSPGEVGEVWVAGPSVAAGYWRRRAESAEAFGAFTRDTGEGPFLRTGDLGFLLGGELYVVGRLTTNTGAAGLGYLPEDLEEVAASSHEALLPGGGAAFTVHVGGQEVLVLAHETDDPGATTAPHEIAQVVRTALTRTFGVAVHDVVLLPASSLPRSPIGKVRRSRCREAYLAGTLGGIR